MAGGLLTGMYSGTRGLDLGPTKLRNDEEFRRKQLMEDMRRALAGEKMQASELALRQGSLDQQRDIEMKRQALEQQMQSQRLEAGAQESALGRGFQRDMAGVEQQNAMQRLLQQQRGQSALQAEEISSREKLATAARELDAQQFGMTLSQREDQWMREFALKRDNSEREGAIQKRALELQEATFALKRQEMEMERAGQLPPEMRREFAMKEQMLQQQAMQLENMRRASALTRGPLEARAGEADIRLTEGKATEQEIRNKYLERESEKPQAGAKTAAKAPLKKLGDNLPKAEGDDAKRLIRLQTDKKVTDVQTAMIAAYEKLDELETEDDADAKKRAEKLHEFLTKAKENEDYNFSLPWWTGGLGLAANALPSDSDLEDMAEELGLWSKGQ